MLCGVQRLASPVERFKINGAPLRRKGRGGRGNMSDCTAYMLDSIPIKWIYDAELGTVESGGVTLLSGVPEWYAETIPLMIYMNRGAGIGHRATRIFYRAILREVAAMHPGTKGPANERLCNLGLREL